MIEMQLAWQGSLEMRIPPLLVIGCIGKMNTGRFALYPTGIWDEPVGICFLGGVFYQIKMMIKFDPFMVFLATK